MFVKYNFFTWNNGFLFAISAKIQPIDQISTGHEYLFAPRRISGDLYHRVTTLKIKNHFTRANFTLTIPLRVFNWPRACKLWQECQKREPIQNQLFLSHHSYQSKDSVAWGLYEGLASDDRRVYLEESEKLRLDVTSKYIQMADENSAWNV